GFLAAWMIPQFGWRSVLVLGGCTPLALVLVMLVGLPESVRFMVAKGYPTEGIRAVLRRISGNAADATSFVMTEKASHQTTSKSDIGLVLSGPFLVGSIMLWLTYFVGLVIFYALINWMPILLKDAGIDQRAATLISA